ncbi:MAG: undecaprenyl/decaprenyl-phosphate alpha-N-acetylglucosaminyl 1-phosphate transferase [Crocinitomicaceae bacterium]|nr:undecaprenyl/decaprenyl-phosphate alpha-N-acetylglucosaminyl 1-phosphate transferase [Crocinitomicaceae bacterium]
MELIIFPSFLIAAFILSNALLPKIIGIVKHKNLMEQTNKRSSHQEIVPTLGGIVFFVTLMLGFYFTRFYDELRFTELIVPGLVILFFVGLKDDLMVLSPYTKFAAQIIACLFVIVHPQFHYVSSSPELFNNAEILVGIIEVVFMVLIINAFNFIDGIDGLAAGIGLIIFSCYVFFFSLLDDLFMMLIYTILIGSLIAFFRFNTSKTKKIFMGDTGSLLLGFMVAIGAIKLLVAGQKINLELPFTTLQFFLMVLSILIVPLFDSSRVILIRLLQKKSPFYPDRNHIHHVLIDRFKLNHITATLLIIWFNLFIILSQLLLSVFIDQVYSFILFVSFIVSLVFLFYAFKKTVMREK